jgi:hypothetical protein
MFGTEDTAVLCESDFHGSDSGSDSPACVCSFAVRCTKEKHAAARQSQRHARAPTSNRSVCIKSQAPWSGCYQFCA